MRTVKPLKIVVESLKRGRDVRPNLIRTNVDKVSEANIINVKKTLSHCYMILWKVETGEFSLFTIFANRHIELRA